MANLTYKIIETATEMFVKQGIKAVGVDDIVAELGISKRTLYEHMESKENLMMHCVKFYADNCKKRFQLIFEEQLSVFEKMLKMVDLNINIMRSTHSTFMEYMLRLAKEYKSKAITAMKNRDELLEKLICEGQKAGDIYPELDPNILVKILSVSTQTLADKELYDFSQISFIDIYETLWFTTFNGMATDKGRNILLSRWMEYEENKLKIKRYNR